MVILDAWAQATPVIAWDLPVFRTTIDRGRTGLLVDPLGGSGALGEAILWMLQNGDCAEKMGQAGYERAAHDYSWQSVAATYLQAYEYAVRHSTM